MQDLRFKKVASFTDFLKFAGINATCSRSSIFEHVCRLLNTFFSKIYSYLLNILNLRLYIMT